jgi:hypothetical protein
VADVTSVPVIATILGGSTGVVALWTALVNRRTAAIGRDKQRAELIAQATAAAPAMLLPARMSHFVDRVEVLERATEQLREGQRLVAIEGAAGVGKSAVATELAHRLRDTATDHGLNQHVFIWIDGRGRTPTIGDVCAQVAGVTGDQALTAVGDKLKLEVLRAHLARSRTVLLLDNVIVPEGSTGDDLRALLSSVPAGCVVVTALSGDDGLAGAARVAVGDLAFEHVIELIATETRRLGIADTAVFGESFARKLYGAVGGNPALIASFLRSIPSSPAPLEELLGSIAHGRGMMRMFAPVWEQLSEDARVAVEVCAILRGRAIIEQVSAACAFDRARATDALAELARRGVVQVVRDARGPERFVCPVGVQRFVRDRAEPERVRELSRRFSSFVVSRIAMAPEDSGWAARHVSAVDAVLGELFDLGEDAELQRLFASVLDVLFTLGRFDDRVSSGGLAFRSALRCGDDRAASLACDVLASTHAARGEITRAREAVAHGELAAERSGDDTERARQQRAHGVVLFKNGEADAAVKMLAGADDRAAASGDREILVNVLGLRTVALLHLGRFDDAEGSARAQLDVCEQMGWQRARAYPLRALAEVELARGNLISGERLAELARSVSTEYGDRRQLVRVRLTQARAALAAGHRRDALSVAEDVEREATVLGLYPESEEAAALRRFVHRTRWMPGTRSRWARSGQLRLTDAPIGGD